MKHARWPLPVCLILLLAACHAGKPLIGEQHHNVLEPRNANDLLDALAANGPEGSRYYSAKADVSFKSGSESRSFKAHVRVVRDSAAWLSITPALGIEVVRVLLTTDSLFLLDKIHDTYWKGDTGAAHRRFGIKPSLSLFQEALQGAPIGLDLKEKYRSEQEDGQYVLVSKEKRRFVRAAEDISPGDTLMNDKDMREKRLERTLRKAEKREAMVYKYWIDPDSMRVARVLITDLAHDQQADVRYNQRITVDGRSLPAHIVLSLSGPGQTATGTLQLDRIQLNGPLNLPFRIPDKFKPMD